MMTMMTVMDMMLDNAASHDDADDDHNDDDDGVSLRSCTCQI